jgi:hypothetical protein
VFRSVLTTQLVAIGGGVVLVGFGLWRVRTDRHLRWAGMRLTWRQLAAWSFLMSSVSGAGLMLLPVLVSGPVAGPVMHMPGMAGPVAASLWVSASATAVHTVAMVTVAGAIALLVYQVIGLKILRTAWLNLDRVWAFALVGAGVATLAANL